MKIEDITNSPDTMAKIADHVSNGGSLIDLCELWQVRYSDVNNWVYNDPARSKIYETAIKARSEWFIQRILKEVRNIGIVDVREIYDDNGNIKDIKDIPQHVAAAIARIETFEEYTKGKNPEYLGRTRKVILVDKMKAIEMLAKHIFFFVEHRIITGDVNVNTNKVSDFDLDERIKKITHATITTMEAERIASDQPNPPPV